MAFSPLWLSGFREGSSIFLILVVLEGSQNGLWKKVLEQLFLSSLSRQVEVKIALKWKLSGL